MDEVRQQKGTGASDCEPLRGPTRTSTTQSAHRGGRQVTLVKSGRSSQAGQARPVKSGWSSEAGQARLVKLGWASDAAAAGKSVAGGWQMVRARAESRAPQGKRPWGLGGGIDRRRRLRACRAEDVDLPLRAREDGSRDCAECIPTGPAARPRRL